MIQRNLYYFAPILFGFVYLVDGQLSTLFTNWMPGTVSVASHLLLIVGIFSTIYLSLTYNMILFAFLGCLYDLYYLHALGVATTLLPLVIYFVYYFYQNLKLKIITNMMILMVIIFFFEFSSFLLARLFLLTNLSMFIFVFYHLVPTLLFNIMLLLFVHPILRKMFGIINKT